jgi:uncharacterized membrane protein
LWLSQKSGISLIRIASVIVVVLMCLSMMMDWKQIYVDGRSGVLSIILNKGYITSLATLASLVITAFLLRKERRTTQGDFYERYGFAVSIVTVLFLYIANLLELRYHLVRYIDSFAMRAVIIGSYNMLCIFLLLLTGNRLRVSIELKRLFPIAGIVAMALYLFYYHGMVIESRNEYLAGISGSAGFIFHYILVVLLILSAVLSLRMLNAMEDLTSSVQQGHWWIYIIFFVFVASAELDHTVVLTGFSGEGSIETLLYHNHKIGFPILWGVSAFILIAVGLKRKLKVVRIISLVLLLATLLKLFVIDLKGISEGGKIAAFISLGILLLVVSFMYQRLKKLLLEDNSGEEETKESV